MSAFIHRLSKIFQPSQPVPAAYRSIFLHLFLDMAWYGVLAGSTVAFLAVYATRQGATDSQIGLLSAVPGLVNLLFALPAGSWLSKRSLGRAVFWTSVMQRAFYLVLLPLPVLLMPHAQVWVILTMTLLMTIPGTALVVGFNAQFGEVVPLEWRGYVAGIRNALLAVISTVFTLLSGWILNWVAFPTGYQVVFTIGILGAGMSSLHLYLLASAIGTRPLNGNGYSQPNSPDSAPFSMIQITRATEPPWRGMQARNWRSWKEAGACCRAVSSDILLTVLVTTTIPGLPARSSMIMARRYHMSIGTETF